ncbi:hypothetical protein [Streptomyces sp. NPDC059761]|uniref:hypothetical protein n=1 Tax=Streptomyces sp. NPDC059761 TaxID=3346937 RepID=UPI0036498E00
MARAHIMRPITGDRGDLIYGAQVLVREAGLSVKLSQPLYAGPTGSAQLSNPHIATDGVIDFWLDVPSRVSVLVTHEQHSDILVYLDAPPSPEETARTDTPLLITGDQVPGNVLLAGDKPGEAIWGPPPMNSGITPRVTVINEAFGLGQDPVGWTFTQAANTARSYSTSVPEDQGLIRSLRVAHTGNSGNFAVVSPGFTLLEPGAVSLWLRPNLTTSEQVVLAVTAQGGARTVLQTLTGVRDWGFYRYPLAAGTYQSISVEFTGASTFTGSTGHEMWATGIRVLYGGQVPAHDHPGTAASSVVLGTGSEALGVGGVAIGYSAKGNGSNSIAVGYRSQATSTDAVAVGADSQAPADSTVAVGARAKGSLAATGWAAIGSDSYADGNNAVAVGKASKAFGIASVAIGSAANAASASTYGVAIGAGAQCLAPNGLALGTGAVVGAGHSASVAIGTGAATSAAGQIMLGSNALYRAVVIGGRFYAVSSVNLGSDATSRLGFFGSEGTAKPIVSGADGGVIALRNLLGALAGLGLITNNTTP